MLVVLLQAVSDMLKDPLLLPQQQHHHDRIACLQEWLAAAAAHSQQGQQQQHRHKQQQKAHEQYQPQQKHREQQPLQQSSSMDVALMLQRLQADIVRCVHADSSYSPYCDMAKSLAGACQSRASLLQPRNSTPVHPVQLQAVLLMRT